MTSPNFIARALDRLETEASSLVCYASAALVALILALTTFGPGYAFGTSPVWEYPEGDVKVNLIGWYHFLAEPWTFPLGLSRQMGPPQGLCIAFTDSLPLIALPAKLVAPLVPDALRPTLLHFFGPWLLAVWVLQALFAVRAVRALGARSIIASLSVAVLTTLLPPFILRQGHAALDAHFYLTWALMLVVLARQNPPSWKHGLEWALLIPMVALTHIYLFAMCGGLLATWALVSLVHHRSVRVAIPAAVSAGVLAALSLYLVGVLGERTAKSRAWGFGDVSWNPASLIIPARSTLVGTRFAHIAEATGFQYEGYSYLGAGVLLLLAFVLVADGRAVLSSLKRHWLLAAAVLVCAAYAASNRVYVGHALVVSYDVPKALEYVTAQLRSSGRFVWPALYLLILFVVVRVARRPRIGGALLGIAALLQLTDSAAEMSNTHAAVARGEHRYLDWQVWRATIAEHDEVSTAPSFDCLYDLRVGDTEALLALNELAVLSAEAGKVVSSAPNPRPYQDCALARIDRETLAPRDKTLYVVMRALMTGRGMANFAEHGIPCFPFPQGYACSRTFADRGSPFAYSPALPDRISLKDRDGDPYVGPGWSWGLTNGRPLDGARATLYLPKPHGHWLEVTSFAFLSANRRTEDIDVEIGGKRIGTLSYRDDDRGSEMTTVLVPLPPEAIKEDVLLVDLVPRDIRTPRELGINEDTRQLSAFVESVRFVE